MEKYIFLIKYIYIYIVKHVCYCCPRLNFKYQICIVSRSYSENFPNELKNEKILKM
jgi:hypothetical protein